MLIQVDLSDRENEIISIFKVKRKLKSKAEAIKKLIDECGALNGSKNSTPSTVCADRGGTSSH